MEEDLTRCKNTGITSLSLLFPALPFKQKYIEYFLKLFF